MQQPCVRLILTGGDSEAKTANLKNSISADLKGELPWDWVTNLGFVAAKLV